MFNEIDWKHKLTSRKFWAAVIAFVTAIMTMLKIPEPTIEQSIILLGAMSSIIAYIIGEGLVDAARLNSTTYLVEKESDN